MVEYYCKAIREISKYVDATSYGANIPTYGLPILNCFIITTHLHNLTLQIFAKSIPQIQQTLRLYSISSLRHGCYQNYNGRLRETLRVQEDDIANITSELCLIIRNEEFQAERPLEWVCVITRDVHWRKSF